jgi:hypothetical protein
VNRVRTAARELGWDGFLLSDDAAIIIQSAAEKPLWRTSAPKPVSSREAGWRRAADLGDRGAAQLPDGLGKIGPVFPQLGRH